MAFEAIIVYGSLHLFGSFCQFHMGTPCRKCLLIEWGLGQKHFGVDNFSCMILWRILGKLHATAGRENFRLTFLYPSRTRVAPGGRRGVVCHVDGGLSHDPFVFFEGARRNGRRYSGRFSFQFMLQFGRSLGYTEAGMVGLRGRIRLFG